MTAPGEDAPVTEETFDGLWTRLVLEKGWTFGPPQEATDA